VTILISQTCSNIRQSTYPTIYCQIRQLPCLINNLSPLLKRKRHCWN